MNVSLENLGPCKKLLRVDVEAARAKQTLASVTDEYVKHAALPGFRPGKAPRDMIIKRFQEDIEKEAKRRLYTEVFKEAVKQHGFDVITDPDVEEVHYAPDQDVKVAFTVEVAPQFEIPEYRGLAAKRSVAKVTDADLDRALTSLREQKSEFTTVSREAQAGDFVVVNYTGTCEGKPITDLAPAARGLTQQKAFWLHLEKDAFIPGFTEQLHGAKAGDNRTVNVQFPADFVTPQLQNKSGTFEVEIVEVKERALPALDDAFAKSWKAESLHQLREGVRADLQNELNLRINRDVRTQVVQGLMDQMTFDLPETLVNAETRSVVYNIVAENQQRGVAKEVIDQQKDEIFNAARKTAQERVKASFVFGKIAHKEGIRVTNDDLNTRVSLLARRYQMTPDKFAKELEKTGGWREIASQILNEKVVDFLQQNAKIEDVETPAPTA